MTYCCTEVKIQTPCSGLQDLHDPIPACLWNTTWDTHSSLAAFLHTVLLTFLTRPDFICVRAFPSPFCPTCEANSMTWRKTSSSTIFWLWATHYRLLLWQGSWDDPPGQSPGVQQGKAHQVEGLWLCLCMAGAKARCGLLASRKPLKGVSCRCLFLKERIWSKWFPPKSLIPLHFVFSLRWVELHTGKEDVLEAALHAK